jgi:hypothetical protein
MPFSFKLNYLPFAEEPFKNFAPKQVLFGTTLATVGCHVVILPAPKKRKENGKTTTSKVSL